MRPFFETALASSRRRTDHRPTMTPIHVRADRYFSSICARAAARFFRRQQAALFGQDHPAITPPVRQHALIVDQVISRLGREDARIASSSVFEKAVIRDREARR